MRGVKVKFFFPVDIIVLTLFVEKTMFCPQNYIRTLAGKQLTTYVQVYF